MKRHTLLNYLIVLVHWLLTINLLVSLVLVFIPHFYSQHPVAHIVWTVIFVLTLLSQIAFKGCPLTIIEKKHLKKINKNIEDEYGQSFIVYWVHKLIGIKIPVWFVHNSKYPYLLLLVLSWLLK